MNITDERKGPNRNQNMFTGKKNPKMDLNQTWIENQLAQKESIITKKSCLTKE